LVFIKGYFVLFSFILFYLGFSFFHHQLAFSEAALFETIPDVPQ